MISTLVPGLAASNLPTIAFSVSVRSGLVITSTSFSVVSASALVANSAARRCGDKQSSSCPFPSSSGCFRSCHWKRQSIAASRSLHSASVPSRPTWRRTDRGLTPKVVRGIGLGLLLQHDLAGHDQAFVAAPADAELEQARGGRRRRGCRCRRGRSKENRPDVPREAGRQRLARPGWSHRLDHRVRLQPPRDLERRRLMRPHADRQRAQAADQQPGIERRRACRRDRDRLRARMRPISSLRAGDDAGHHVAVAAEIFRGRMDDEVDAERRAAAGRSASPSCCR